MLQGGAIIVMTRARASVFAIFEAVLKVGTIHGRQRISGPPIRIRLDFTFACRETSPP